MEIFNVKEMRKERKMSQEELAKSSGVSRCTISSLENNREKNVSIATLNKLARALNVSLKNFLWKG